MDQNRSVEDASPHELLEYIERLHHTDEDLARRALKAVLVGRAQRNEFREPSLEVQSENGVIHVSL